MIFTILIWIFMFMILIIAHELWHFFAARKSWVKVLEFWIGIPPKLFSLWKDKKWTEYTINLIPLWGFCRLKWEDPNNKKDFHSKDSFISSKFLNKIFILFWWVFANLIIAWIIFTAVFTIWTKPISVLPENAIKWESYSLLMPTYSHLQKKWFLFWDNIKAPLIIQTVMDDSIASQVWFLPWDTINTINWQDVDIRNVWKILKSYIWQNIDISYTRSGKTYSSSSQCPEYNCVLGISFNNSWALSLKDIKYPIHQAVLVAIKEIWAQMDLSFSALWRIWSNLLSFNGSKIKWSLNWMTWPIWVIKFWENIFSNWWWILYIAFTWLISLALAIFNILPIPALDWWRILWVLIQKSSRLKPEKYFIIEWYINTVFFVLLMAMWVYIILKDLVIFRWINIPFVW